MRLAIVAVLAATGCGRFGFGEDPARDGAAMDVIVDASDAGDALQACPANAIVCDDFEDGTTAAWTGTTVSETSVTINVSTVRAHAGMYALDASVPAIADGNYATVYLDIPLQTTGVLATRQWIYAQGMFTRFDEVVGLFHTGVSNQYMVLGCDDLEHWAATERSTASGIVDHLTTVPCAPDVWYCVELVYSFDTKRVQVFVDNAALLDVAVADPMPAFDDIGLGAVRADAAGFRVFTDDVVIAPQRIGCQ